MSNSGLIFPEVAERPAPVVEIRPSGVIGYDVRIRQGMTVWGLGAAALPWFRLTRRGAESCGRRQLRAILRTQNRPEWREVSP